MSCWDLRVGGWGPPDHPLPPPPPLWISTPLALPAARLGAAVPGRRNASARAPTSGSDARGATSPLLHGRAERAYCAGADRAGSAPGGWHVACAAARAERTADGPPRCMTTGPEGHGDEGVR